MRARLQPRTVLSRAGMVVYGPPAARACAGRPGRAGRVAVPAAHVGGPGGATTIRTVLQGGSGAEAKHASLYRTLLCNQRAGRHGRRVYLF